MPFRADFGGIGTESSEPGVCDGFRNGLGRAEGRDDEGWACDDDDDEGCCDDDDAWESCIEDEDIDERIEDEGFDERCAKSFICKF